MHRLIGAALIAVLSLVLGGAFVAAENTTANLHLNLQFTNASGQIENGTWNLTFNLSRNNNCSDIVWANSTDVTADSRGIVAVELQNITGNFSEQLWLCYERNGTLKANHRLARVPYAFRAENVSAGGVVDDSTLNLTRHNASFNWTWVDAVITRVGVLPFTDATADLGNTTLQFRALYAGTWINGSSQNVSLSQVAALVNRTNLTNVSDVNSQLANVTALGNLTNGTDHNHTFTNLTMVPNFTNISQVILELTLRNYSNTITNFTNGSEAGRLINATVGTNVTLPPGAVNFTHLSNFTNDRNFTNLSAIPAGLTLRNFTNDMNYTNVSALSADLQLGNGTVTDPAGLYQNASNPLTAHWQAGNFSLLISSLVLNNTGNALALVNATSANGSFVVDARGNVNASGNISGTIGNFTGAVVASNLTDNVYHILVRNITEAVTYLLNVTRAGLIQNGTGNLSFSQLQMAVNYTTNLSALVNRTNWTANVTNATFYTENVTQRGLLQNSSGGALQHNLSASQIQAAINYSAQLKNLTDITNLTNGTTHLVSYGNLTGGPPNFTEGFNATEARGLDALNFSNNISVAVKNASCLQIRANETIIDLCK